MSIRTASVFHSRDGYGLSVREVPLAAVVAEKFIEHVVCPATFHLACCHIPGWAWKAGTGDRNLGSALFSAGQWLGAFGYKREREVWRCPLSFEEVCQNFPESRVEWDDDGKEYSRGVRLPVVQEEHRDYGVVS